MLTIKLAVVLAGTTSLRWVRPRGSIVSALAGANRLLRHEPCLQSLSMWCSLALRLQRICARGRYSVSAARFVLTIAIDVVLAGTTSIRFLRPRGPIASAHANLLSRHKKYSQLHRCGARWHNVEPMVATASLQRIPALAGAKLIEYLGTNRAYNPISCGARWLYVESMIAIAWHH